MLQGAFKGAVRGAVIGSVTSGTSAGFMGRRAKISQVNGGATKWHELKNTSFLDAAAWAASSKPGAIAVEGLGFTTVGNLYDMAAGKDVRWENFARDFLSNSMLVAGLRGKHKTFETVVSPSLKNARKFLSKRHENLKESNPTYKNIVEKLQKEREVSPEAGQVIKEQLDILGKEIKESSEVGDVLRKDLKIFEEKVEKIKEALNKSPEDFAKMKRKLLKNFIMLSMK